MHSLLAISLLITTFLSLTYGTIPFRLTSDDAKWTVSNENKSIKIEARVPGGIYSDLQKSGLIDNIFYRFNDIESRWVAHDSWTYETTFRLPSDLMNKTSVDLVFHGLDTIADVRVNGQLIAFVNNMFVRYVLPIKNFLNANDNSLEVSFQSPIAEAIELSNEQKKNYSVPPECNPSQYNGECHINFLRKMQASFAWDWGPAFPSVGIWKPVEIEAFDSAIIRDIIAITSKINETTWRINATIYLESAAKVLDQHYITAVLTSPQGKETEAVTSEAVKDPNNEKQYIANAYVDLKEEAVQLWWPNGFGEQALYDLSVTFQSPMENENSTKSIKIGIRTVELIQEEVQPGLDGLTFYFKINGIPIFAKGSNYIPSHILPELGYEESAVKDLLLSAKEANMNMLRVWGGGVYESDFFYQTADELGIMIWQDLMFACAMYPANDEFLNIVKVEIEQQVRRLQHHPSIVIWAGNNENEAALQGNWYGTSSKFELYKNDYVQLYVNTIQPIIEAVDESRPYIVSSPTNGLESIKEGYISSRPYSPLYGDLHFYNYLLDPWNSNLYPNTRFASEYGFQSMPSFEALSEVSLPDDLKINGEFFQKRQHLSGGNTAMQLLIRKRLPFPFDDGSVDFIKTLIYYSQISQAMGTKTETEKYRRDRSKLTETNEGRTMGALYWQLNDVWQAPSWSSIEFGGRWKMLHYFAKKFFAPVLVSPELKVDNEVDVFLISDLLTDIPDLELNISVYSWSDFTPKKVASSKRLLKNATSEIHANFNLDSLLSESECNKNECFIYCSLLGKEIFSDNILFPTTLKDAKLEKANISVNVLEQSNSNVATIRLTADRIAPFVWLETEEFGKFSDNGFTLIENQIEINFSNRNQAINLDRLKNTLTVRSLI